MIIVNSCLQLQLTEGSGRGTDGDPARYSIQSNNVEQKIETKLSIVHLRKLSLKCWISFFVVTLQMSSLRRPWPRRDYKYVEASVNGGHRPWSLHNQGITKFLYYVLLLTLYYTWWPHNTVFAPILPRTDFAPGRRLDKWRGGAKLAMSIFDKTQKKANVYFCLFTKRKHGI